MRRCRERESEGVEGMDEERDEIKSIEGHHSYMSSEHSRTRQQHTIHAKSAVRR